MVEADNSKESEFFFSKKKKIIRVIFLNSLASKKCSARKYGLYPLNH